MSKFGLKPLANDPHTYVAHKVVDGVKRTLILPVYVDDLLPIGDKVLCDEFERWIPEFFNVTISGDASLVLGIRVVRHRSTKPPFVAIDQEAFAEEIVTRIRSDTLKPATTLLSSQEQLTRNEGQAKRETVTEYQRLIGSLMYLMLGTRPDLAYAVSKLSRFSSNPSDEHIHAAIRVVSYIRAHSATILP